MLFKEWCISNKYEKLLDEWNDDKNLEIGISLDEMEYEAGRKIWWVCSKSHEWKATISHRVNGTNCPYCSNQKILYGYNDLMTLYPDIAEEWHPRKNNSLKPCDVGTGTSKKVWWLGKCGHEWEAPVYSRTNGCGCPICSNKLIIKGYNDLQTTYPKLMNEWNYERNSSISPQMISKGSNKKVWWKCKEGHEWKSTVASRTYYNLGCPYCSGRYAVKGKSDFATMCSELLNEWDYEKNTVQPSELKRGSHAKVWWKCFKGHSYLASIHSRTGKVKSGCPVCAKELQISLPEKCVYYYIKQIFPSAIENYRSSWLGNLELDIFIPEINLALEYDGQNWHTDVEKDIRKNKICETNGVKLIRIREPKCPVIGDECEIRLSTLDLHELNYIIPLVFKKIGISEIIDCNIERDMINIYSIIEYSIKENSLASQNPNLLLEWDYEKNKGINPFTIPYGSGKKFWFKCKEGHVWNASVSNRTKMNSTGCPYCSNQKVLAGYNDLATTHAYLLDEWDYAKNEITPNEVVANIHKKAWWKCQECGFEWQAEIKSRVVGNGCPECAKQKRRIAKSTPKSGKSLKEKYPQICEEWDYANNGELRPEDVNSGSHRKVFWKCLQHEHSYEMEICNKVNGRNCPYCSGKRILIGFNDMATLYPALVKEWDVEKNDELSPHTVSKGSNKKVWWRCSRCQHSYQRIIAEQVKARRCPLCKNKV